MVNVKKLSDKQLEELRKKFSNSSDYQSVRAFVTIMDEIERREKGGKR